jgi:DNA primase catalytic core
MSKKFGDIDLVRQDLKANMPLDQFMSLADGRYSEETGNASNPIERISDHLYKKKCDLDEHPVDRDGTRDSTASFTICPPKELWHCFGCGISGDRFEYISRKFNVDHLESIAIVAEIQGFDLQPYYVELSVEEQVKIQLFNDNNMAREKANQRLMNSPDALNYLHGRGITNESIELFKLGYAPVLTDGIVHLFSDIPNSLALQLDRKGQFNDAILFPITDTMGKMRYFQSRPFHPLPGMKYIGGDDTHPLFDETDRIFGFPIAKRKLPTSKGRLIGVEGAPDTIACVQQGINAVGFLGTAINQNTFDLLDKYRVVELVMLLDGDKAGRNKSLKNAEKYLGLKTNVRLKIATMPEGYDPEEYINKFGADSLKEYIDSAVYAIQYLIDSKWNDATTPTAKMEFMFNIQPYMVAVIDNVTRQIMITHIASKIGLDPVQIEDYYMQATVQATGAKLFSLEGEEVLLGEAMRNPQFIPELTMRFKDDDWYLLKHKHLFRILKSAEYTDIESLYVLAKNMNIDNIVTHSWLEKLHSNDGNVEFSLKDVEDKVIRRKALSILEESKLRLNDLSSDVSLTIDKASTNMYDTMHHKSSEFIFDAGHQVKTTMQLIMDRMNNPVRVIGWSFGKNFEKLDGYTLGLQTKTLTVIAANQTVGKTQLCENFGMHWSCLLKVPTLWFSLEMDEVRMTYRNLAILSGLDAQALATGNITIEEKMILDQAAVMLMQSPYYISERGHDLSESLAIARKYVQTNHVKIIVIDYAQLQYVTDRRTDTRSRELGVISKAWKQFSKEMDVAVVLISQLGKQALEAETAEAEHGYGSYEIAQDADNYYTLKDKSEEEINQRGIEHGNKTMNISKNRMGEKGILIDVFSAGANYQMMEV